MENKYKNNLTITLCDLFKILNLGTIEKDCIACYFDKLGNLKFNNTVVYIQSEKDLPKLNDSRISGLITTPLLAYKLPGNNEMGVWVYDNPQELFFLIHELLIETNFYYIPWNNNISPNAIISPSAKIADYSIEIGDNCVIEDNVVIKPNTIIGKNTKIRCNCVIGSDGFEVHILNGKSRVIKHGGLTIIGNNVELQPMVLVAKGLFPSRNTIIEDNVKVDALVHIAHASIIREGTMITAGVTIAGNTTIGKNVYIGPGAIISNRVNIGDNSYITIGSVVVRDIPDNSKVSGNFAVDHTKSLKHYASVWRIK